MEVEDSAVNRSGSYVYLCVCVLSDETRHPTRSTRPLRPPPYSGSSASIRGWVHSASRRAVCGPGVSIDDGTATGVYNYTASTSTSVIIRCIWYRRKTQGGAGRERGTMCRFRGYRLPWYTLNLSCHSAPGNPSPRPVAQRTVSRPLCQTLCTQRSACK